MWRQKAALCYLFTHRFFGPRSSVDRALASGARGRWFDSSRGYSILLKTILTLSQFYLHTDKQMNFKRLALILISLFACIFSVSAQEAKCSMKLADLPSIPELRGFHMGMTIEEVKARLPNVRLRPADEFGSTALNIFPDYEKSIDKAAFAGVRSISLEFLDGRVTSVWIGYDKTFKWQELEEFEAAMTAALKLPNAWRTKFRTRLMDCADFTVAIIPVGESPSIRISDEAARELLEKRKAAKEDARP